MVHSIELKFSMYITYHYKANPIDFGECRTHSFFIGVKIIPLHYGLWNQILKTVLVSKRCIRLSSNLVCILNVKVQHIVPILINLGIIVFFSAMQK